MFAVGPNSVVFSSTDTNDSVAWSFQCSTNTAMCTDWLIRRGTKLWQGGPTGCRVRTTIDLSEMVHDVSVVKFCTTLSSLWWMNSSCRARKHVADARTAADIHKTRDLFCLLYLINSSRENECRVRELVCGRPSTPLGS